MPAAHRPALIHAPLRVGGRVRGIGCDGSPLRDLATQLAFKVTGSPAVLSQAVRDPARGCRPAPPHGTLPRARMSRALFNVQQTRDAPPTR